jgi:hypothetical protein
MPYYDNPAGRLHDLLIRLAEQPGNNSVLDGWAAVLSVESGDVIVHLGRVALLVGQIQDAVDRAGEAAIGPQVQRFRRSWAQPIFPQDYGFADNLEFVRPDQASLEVLHLVSAQLHSIAPEGLVPGEDEIEKLKSQLRALIDQVEVANDIPDEVKHLVIARLMAVEEAMAHLKIGGPRALRRAVEAVVGGVVFTQDSHVAKSSTIKNMLLGLAVIWTAFSSAPTIQDSIEAWQGMIPLLGAGTQQSEVRPADEHGNGNPDDVAANK